MSITQRIRTWPKILQMAKRRKLSAKRIELLKEAWLSGDPHWRMHLAMVRNEAISVLRD
jgi:hypothetical protein